MGHIKVTNHFHKNGRMTGYGNRSTGNARKFLSVLPWSLAYAGKFGEFEKLYKIVVKDEVVGFVRYDENTRETTYQMNAGVKIEIDINMRQAIRDIDMRVLENRFAKYDTVMVEGEPADVIEGQKRIDEKWMVAITYNNVETLLVPLSNVSFVC